MVEGYCVFSSPPPPLFLPPYLFLLPLPPRRTSFSFPIHAWETGVCKTCQSH